VKAAKEKALSNKEIISFLLKNNEKKPTENKKEPEKIKNNDLESAIIFAVIFLSLILIVAQKLGKI